MWAVPQRRGLTCPSMILVWNGPKRTLSLTVTSSSTSTSWGPPLVPSDWASPTLPGARTTVLFKQESNCTILAVAQGIERRSISLSQIMLIIQPIIQVPMGTLQLNSDSSGTMRNTTSSSYPAISRTCRITKPSGLVHFPPNPTRFNGWLTRSSSSRTGNPYCCMKAGVIVFTQLPLSAKALTFLPSIVKSTSISGPIQCETGPPTSNSGSQICPITWTFTSGRWFIILRAG